MKKGMIVVVLMLLTSLLGCCYAAPKADVTWEELLKANQPEAVFSRTDSFSVKTTDDDGAEYISYAAMVKGDLISSSGTADLTDDLLNGVIYNARGEDARSVTIIAPTARMTDLLEGVYAEELKDFEPVGDITLSKGQYAVRLRQVDEDWGVATDAEAWFDAETLLLTRVEMTVDMFLAKFRQISEITYDVDADFPMPSYQDITGTEDQVKLLVHYPDGGVKELSVDRGVTLIAYYPDHEESWSVCWDEACTASVDNLEWVAGDSAHVYLCEGYVPAAPPMLENVLKHSTFEAVFKENYDSYYQISDVTDPEWNTISLRELAWYMDEKDGLCLNFEIKDREYNPIVSGRARDNAWYFWTEEEGYSVAFYDEFGYAEDRIKDHYLVIEEEKLTAGICLEDEYLYYIPYAETFSDGTVKEYRYCIHPDIACIDRVEITTRDRDGKVLEREMVYIGGNGPIPGDKDIISEITEPSGGKAVKLTVVTAAGEKTYRIRRDAKISWKGEALYSDKECTQAVTDLAWVSGDKATVYAK